MNLCIKEKFSWKESFYVYDEAGNPVYQAVGKAFSFGHKVKIYNMAQEEVADIKQQMWSFTRKYAVTIAKETYEVRKRFALTPKYEVAGKDWEIRGNFFAYDFVMKQNDRLIAEVEKRMFTWADTYDLMIVEKADALLALCVMLIIDMDKDDGAASSASASAGG